MIQIHQRSRMSWWVAPFSASVFLLIGLCHAEPAEVTTDQASNHATGPIFLNTFKEEEIAERLKTIQPEKIIKEIEANRRSHPPVARVVIYVNHPSQASRLGITPFCKMLLYEHEAGSDGKLHWTDEEGNYHADPVEKGKVGVNTMEDFDSIPWYLFTGNRNSKWDAMVVAALYSQEDDFRLADAFWKKAIDLGYPPDHLSNLSGMIIAMWSHDLKRAEAFAKVFGPINKAPEALCKNNFQVWTRLAAVTGNPIWIQHSIDTAEKYLPKKPAIAKKLRSTMEMQVKLAKQHEGKTLKSPSELAKTMKHRSFLDNYSTDANWAPWRENALMCGCFDFAVKAKNHVEMPSDPRALAVKDGTFTPAYQTMKPNRWTAGWIGPKAPARDIDITACLTVTPKTEEGRDASNGKRGLEFGVCGRNSKNAFNYETEAHMLDTQVMGLIFDYGFSYQGLEASMGIFASDEIPKLAICTEITPHKTFLHKLFPLTPAIPLYPGMFHTVRIVRVGSQAEALVDGERVALLNVPLEIDDIGLYHLFSGAEVMLNSIEADVLE